MRRSAGLGQRVLVDCVHPSLTNRDFGRRGRCGNSTVERCTKLLLLMLHDTKTHSSFDEDGWVVVLMVFQASKSRLFSRARTR